MNGVHDMGGMDGFGKVEPEENEPVFHAPWEGRVLAMNRVMAFSAGLWNIDVNRAATESLPPDIYLSRSYYEKWQIRLEKQLVKYGIIAPDELAAGRSLHPAKPLKRKFTVNDLGHALTRGQFGRPAQAPACFKVGDRVRMKNIHPTTHTRLPRYVRGHVGEIALVHGCHVFPDSVVRGEGENPQWVYTVRFDSQELWGPDADPTVKISVEAFEPYLDPA
jgi:nitrile hydratase beta subunit